MSGTVKVGLESTDGRVDIEILAQTSRKICGAMMPMNWLQVKHNWSHLKNIPFPKLAKGKCIDVLLGADNYELMYSMREVVGKPDEPVARLCPLGWTVIGRISEERSHCHHSRLHHTFRVQSQEPERNTSDGDLSTLVRRFWEIETMGTTSDRPAMGPDESRAWDKVSNSLRFEDGHYVVAVPWKDERPVLPNNKPAAEKRLISIERKLTQDPVTAKAYQDVIDDYLAKNYIRKVPPDEPQPDEEWLLPHFPVVRPDKTSTKTRIVFDASAEYLGKSVNGEALTGPKLQADLFAILVRFRKEPVALVGDISQMYHQLALTPEDRPLRRFLWRNLDLSRASL